MKKNTPFFLLRILLMPLCSLFLVQQAHTAAFEKPALLQGSSSLDDNEAITAKDYGDFLQASAANNLNDLYDATIATGLGSACIVRFGMPGSYHYEVMDQADTPMHFISLNDATQYCDWCNHSASTSTYTLNSCDYASAHVDSSLKSNLLTFRLASTAASVSQSGGPEVIAEAGIDEIFEDLLTTVFVLVGLEGSSTLASETRDTETAEHPIAKSNRSFRKSPTPVMEGGYLFPKAGGCFHNGRWYSGHALERMAPDTEEMRALLQARTEKRAQASGIEVGTDAFKAWLIKNEPQLREILPAEVEAAIAHPHAMDLNVITSEEGDVITVFRRTQKYLSPLPELGKPNLPLANAKNFNCYQSSSPSFKSNSLYQFITLSTALPDEPMSVAAHEAQQRAVARMLKMDQTVKTLRKNADRALKAKKYESPFYWDKNEWERTQEMRKKEFQSIVDTNNSMKSDQALEAALEKLRKKTGNIVRNILKVRSKPSVKLKIKKKYKAPIKVLQMKLQTKKNNTLQQPKKKKALQTAPPTKVKKQSAKQDRKKKKDPKRPEQSEARSNDTSKKKANTAKKVLK